MALTAGPFGPFDLIEPLGRGGMGEVWLARAIAVPGADGLCVVKTVRNDIADDADAVKRFGDESRLALLLIHPRIGRVIDAGHVAEVRYLALDLIEGIDVVTLMRRAAERHRAVEDIVALWIAACAFDALSFAHGARHPLTGAPLGVVHRDMSPQNVMCGADGSACVIDFGLALSTVKQAKTEQNVVMGKLAYLAPEQSRGERLDARCDIYSVGVLLYELLAHERYWGALDSRDILLRVALGSYEPPSFGALDGDLRALLTPMFARDPVERESDAARCRDRTGAVLHARGGAKAASRALANLVEELAEPELLRIRKARGVPAASPPLRDDDRTERLARIPNAESFAVAEAKAIAKAAEAKTLELPAFTTMMIEAAARARTSVTPAAVPAHAPAPAPALTLNIRADRTTSARAPSTPSSTVLAAAPAGKAPYVVAGVAVAVAVLAIGAIAFLVDVVDAPAPPTTDAMTATRGPTGTPTTKTTATTATTATAATTATTATPGAMTAATPTAGDELPADPLADALAALRGCKQMCAKELRNTSVERLDAIRANPLQLNAVLHTARNCAAICKQ